METLSLLAINALNGGGGGGGDVTPDGITTEFNASEELQANAVIKVSALPSTGIMGNSLYHVAETVTYTTEGGDERTFTMYKLFHHDVEGWRSYATINGLTQEDYDHLTEAQKNDGTTYVVNGGGSLADTTKATVNDVSVEGDLTGTDLGLINESDFVNTPTGKTDGMEFLLPVGTPTSPTVLSEIDDSAEMKYSLVHTSSNDYINHKLEAIQESLVGKLNLQFVNAMPDPPDRNTQYYVATSTEGVWDIYIVDNTGTVYTVGTTELDLNGLVRDTRKVAGNALSADVTAAMIEDATKGLSSTLTNKTIDADDNTIADLTVSNAKSGVVQTSVSSSSTDTQLPTAKAVYSYAVKKTTDANKVYGSSTTFDRVTSVSSSSTDTQIPTAKAVYSYAVPQSATGNRVYGTNSSGGETVYPFSDTYTSSADNQMFTRKGAYNLYNGVFSGNTAMVFAGNVTRTSSQSVNSNTSTAISLTGSDVYRTALIRGASSGVYIVTAGTYYFQVVARLADTGTTTRHWYLGLGTTSMLDDQAGGTWNYTYNRHKAEASLLRYCAAGEVIKPYVYIDSNSGSVQYATVHVWKCNEK